MVRTALICGFWVLSCALAGDAPASCAPEGRSSHELVRVLDGETLLLDDGREVRLIGALPPAHARDAAQVLQELTANRSVVLRYEGRRQDRYGRVLAQVFAPGETGDPVWIQERLVGGGYARAYALPGNTSCIATLLAAEETARSDRRGLWKSGVFHILQADDTRSLLTLSGHFAIVEGHVSSVSSTQRTTYLNFGPDWKRDFTASLSRGLVEAAQDGAARVSAFAGKRIRVRGWIERRNGPMVVLNSLDEIEVLDDNPHSAGDEHGTKKQTGPR